MTERRLRRALAPPGGAGRVHGGRLMSVHSKRQVLS